MVRKILLTLFKVFALVLVAILFIHGSALASDCNLVAPASIGDHANNVNFTIDTQKNLPSGPNDKYTVFIGGNDDPLIKLLIPGAFNDCANGSDDTQCYKVVKGLTISTAADGTKTITFNSGASWDHGGLQSGWKLWVDLYHDGQIDSGTTPACNHGNMTFSVTKDINFGTCQFTMAPEKPTPQDDFTMKIDAGSISGHDGFHLYLYKTSGGDALKEWGQGGIGCPGTTNLKDNGWDLGKLDSNDYKLLVNECNPGGVAEAGLCEYEFNVTPTGGGHITSTEGTPCKLCPGDSSWNPDSSCANDPLRTDNCCITKTSLKWEAAQMNTCPQGTMCDATHRSQDQSTANAPTGCIPTTGGCSGAGCDPGKHDALCSTKDTDGHGGQTCTSIDTGLGVPLPTDPGGLINTLLGIVLSIAGGIAIVLIMISGYKMMVSQGNPEQIKDAREQLTAAIIGLLFVVFSLVILQIIGVNILNLPGFKP